MNALGQMLLDMIQEQQLKLGYVEETVRLYIPGKSLRGILSMDQNATESELEQALYRSIAEITEYLGEVGFRQKDGRYALVIPPQGSRYVHENAQESPFLRDLIHVFSGHGLNIEMVKSIFEKYDSGYVCEVQEGIEFDYLLYFSDKSVDPYYYCVKFDVGHASYHRFNAWDIKEILGKDNL